MGLDLVAVLGEGDKLNDADDLLETRRGEREGLQGGNCVREVHSFEILVIVHVVQQGSVGNILMLLRTHFLVLQGF